MTFIGGTVTHGYTHGEGRTGLGRWQRTNGHAQHADLAGSHGQRQSLFVGINNNRMTFFILTRQLQADLNLHRLVNHIL